jgi:alpha,alpha-trehalose-phosphate synthase [UDP-forming]
MWTQARLEAVARKCLKHKKLIIVSNREPYVHQYHDGKIVCVSPAGGLTSALKPVISAAGGTWVAQATGSADRETASPSGVVNVPPENPAFTLRRLWIPAELQHDYYEGLANQALWPLCHNVYQRPQFREADWRAYRRVNEMFAQAVLDEARGREAVVFIQDYHLALLPRLLKRENPRLCVAHFWHIPWPGPEIAQTFPWIDELLDGMLGNDLLGFHLDRHSVNFIDTVDSVLPAQTDRLRRTVRLDGHSTVVRDAPISIDFERHAAIAASPEVEDAMRAWRERLGGVRYIGLGIDRIDYTKGIPERLRALDLLLERSPTLRGALTFVQVGVPSRCGISTYARLERAIAEQVDAINRRWGAAGWQPVVFEKRNAGLAEMTALHRLAHFCMVTPLHDGMNLVAKEFVASRIDQDGVLILSRFAGAARELKTALQVNPFCETSIGDAISTALTMPRSERQRRMAAARETVRNNNIFRWAGALLEEIEQLGRAGSESREFAPFGRLAASVA